jgi:site-specific recombinase XerD
MQTYSKAVLGLSAIRSESFLEHFGEYQAQLAAAGYSESVVRLHLNSVAHFGVWLEREGFRLEMSDDETVAAFSCHREQCACQGVSTNRGRHVDSCVRVFVRYLRGRGAVQAKQSRQLDVLVREFLEWMIAHRGVVDKTLASYERYVAGVVEFLGNEPQAYTARGLRDFVRERYRHYGRNSVRMVLAAVRMFLRYLATDGRCRPGLEQALVAPANWARSSLPRGLRHEDVERVLAACPSTARGSRDRAVLLLLIRLGLRAGDVAGLMLSDVCFQQATITLHGKGRREVRLPLPQDVGDALLEYLRAGRPPSESQHVFLRSMAPHTPFSGNQPGYAVTHIARSALKRAGVQVPTAGAHVFRHTAACQMLRQGVGLEGIADVLRHRSVETTAIYAKVDIQLLEQVAQPWPEGTPC